jgi:hypothetical protein
MEPEAPIYHKCGGELNKRSYKKDGQRSILAAIVLFSFFLFIGWGTAVSLLPLLLLVIIGIYLIRKKPEHYYTCRKCYLKISGEDLDP